MRQNARRINAPDFSRSSWENTALEADEAGNSWRIGAFSRFPFGSTGGKAFRGSSLAIHGCPFTGLYLPWMLPSKIDRHVFFSILYEFRAFSKERGLLCRGKHAKHVCSAFGRETTGHAGCVTVIYYAQPCTRITSGALKLRIQGEHRDGQTAGEHMPEAAWSTLPRQ